MEVVVVLGYPASGKSSWLLANLAGHRRLNRDEQGGTLEGLLPKLEIALGQGDSVAMDNTYISRESRAGVIAVGQRLGVPVRCVWIDTSIENAQVNAVTRMVARYGRLLSPDEIKKTGKKDPNTFGPGVLFKYRKAFEEPSPTEGWSSIERVKYVRRPQGPEYANKALLLDFDGTLRTTKSGEKYPRSPDDIEILPGRRATLARYQADGYRLCGVSNQGDVARGRLSEADARACFDRTCDLLGLDIEVSFCPHDPAPIGCFCRKPMPGMGVDFIERHKLDRAQTIMVGDMTTDATFASRVGVRYMDQAEFFR